MPRLLADLHLHSVLSPCGDLDMSPQKIVQRARACGLDLIAVTDHNSAENARAIMRAGEREGIVVLPGLEVTTKEEVHILCLFDRPNDAESLQNFLYGRLGDQLNDPEYFGFQVICDDQDEILGFQPKLLIQAADVSLGELVAQVKALGGMAVAAHIDRPAFGLISQLGFIPKGLELSALEVSSATPVSAIRQAMPQLDDYPIIRSSDAHFLDDIGRGYVELNVDEPDIEGIEQALWSLWQSNHERTFPSHSRYR